MEGDIYFKPKAGLVLKVRSPVSQIIIYAAGTTTVFYPETGRAFRIRTKNLVSLADTFVGFLKEDLGLSESGFTLEGDSFENETLETNWKPPKSLAKIVKNATLRMKKDKSTVLTILGTDGKIMFELSYIRWVRKGALHFPGEARVYQPAQDATDTIRYSQIKVNEDLPVDPETFTLPEGTLLKE
jgi:outer membrane lipoprotein-sorting protein